MPAQLGFLRAPKSDLDASGTFDRRLRNVICRGGGVELRAASLFFALASLHFDASNTASRGLKSALIVRLQRLRSVYTDASARAIASSVYTLLGPENQSVLPLILSHAKLAFDDHASQARRQ